MTLNPEARFRLTPDSLVRELQGESVLLDLRTGLYYGLNQLGTSIVRRLEQSARLRELHQQLLEEYEIGPDDLWDDLSRFLAQMEERGLIEVVTG